MTWPRSISSTPFIDKDRVYYVSNRGELCCLKVADGKIVWMLDMPKTLGVFRRDPNDAGNLAPSPIVVGDIVYCITGNGADDGYREPPAPDAPSFLAVDKFTGKVIWFSRPGKNVRYGQWSTPALATVDGAAEILFPGGDARSMLLNRSVESNFGKLIAVIRSTKTIACPPISLPPRLVVGQTAYVSVAVDFEMSQRPQRLLAIDLRSMKFGGPPRPRNSPALWDRWLFPKGRFTPPAQPA